MMSGILFYLTLAAALGAGSIAGVFFAFSSFVMPALARLPTAQGVAAMQSIGVTVLTRSFLSVFVGTAVLCSIAAILSLSGWSQPSSKLRIAGSGLYVAGTFLVTLVGNVPLNDALAKTPPESAAAAELWAKYVPQWSTWNSVRALAALGAAAALTLSLTQRANGD